LPWHLADRRSRAPWKRCSRSGPWQGGLGLPGSSGRLTLSGRIACMALALSGLTAVCALTSSVLAVGCAQMAAGFWVAPSLAVQGVVVLQVSDPARRAEMFGWVNAVGLGINAGMTPLTGWALDLRDRGRCSPRHHLHSPGRRSRGRTYSRAHERGRVERRLRQPRPEVSPRPIRLGGGTYRAERGRPRARPRPRPAPRCRRLS
jgi:hypothetical protein